MHRRFDLRYSIESHQWILKENLPEGQQSTELKNWIIEIKNDNLIVVGLSKANKTKERILLYPLKEGSLFLYNSTYNWYSYFRDKELQDIFDKHNIVKCVNIQNQTILIHCAFTDGISINPVTKVLNFQPEKFFKNVTRNKYNSTKTLENFYILYSLNEGNKGIIVQKGKTTDSKIVYISSNLSLYDLDWYLSSCEVISDFSKYIRSITRHIGLCKKEDIEKYMLCYDKTCKSHSVNRDDSFRNEH